MNNEELLSKRRSGMTVEEIAKETGMHVQSVRRSLKRAIEALPADEQKEFDAAARRPRCPHCGASRPYGHGVDRFKCRECARQFTAGSRPNEKRGKPRAMPQQCFPAKSAPKPLEGVIVGPRPPITYCPPGVAAGALGDYLKWC